MRESKVISGASGISPRGGYWTWRTTHAFLVPVVIDDTRESHARVPEEFLRAQWTRLPGGETPPAFAHRVRQLLGGDGAPVRTQATVTGEIESSVRKAAGGRGKHRVRGVGLALIALLLVLGAGAFWYYQSANEPPVASLRTTSPFGRSTRLRQHERR